MRVKDILRVLDQITGGRCVKDASDLEGGKNRFVLTKSSGIPGKECTEIPGLVFGNPDSPLKKIAVVMTLTESCIELAAASGIDAIIAHHPVADGASCGGVTLRNYLSLYGIAVFELHEAFHGLHPGIAYIHGHRVFHSDIAYGGVPGNVLFVGRVIEGVTTLADIIDRMSIFAGFDEELEMLSAERRVRKCPSIEEATVSTPGEILLGNRKDRVGTIIHIFPHTGFTAEHLAMAKKEYPEADTVVASISRLSTDNEIVKTAAGLGLKVVLGNSHALEILENGLPLAVAVQKLLPEAQVFVFRERVTATPVEMTGNPIVREYADAMAEQFLIPRKTTQTDS
jgi:putative NIF3 family GTP cyclohydrolase 1 type 2